MKLFNLKSDFILKNYKLIILIFLIMFLIISFYHQQSNQTNYNSIGSKKLKVKKNKEKDPYFDISLLKSLTDKGKAEGRDLFNFYNPPIQNQQPQLPPPAPVVETTERINPDEEANLHPKAQEPPLMSQIKIFGILSKNGKELYAFLSDGKEVYVVKKDDIFANQFKVIHIDEDKIEFSTLKDNFRKILTLSGG